MIQKLKYNFKYFFTKILLFEVSDEYLSNSHVLMYCIIPTECIYQVGNIIKILGNSKILF